MLAVAKRFDETGGAVLATIERKPRLTPPVAPIVTGEVKARLIALACSAHLRPSRAGRCDCWSTLSTWSRIYPIWTTPLYAIGRVIKMKLRPHLRKCWTIPPHAYVEFAAGM